MQETRVMIIQGIEGKDQAAGGTMPQNQEKKTKNLKFENLKYNLNKKDFFGITMCIPI